MNRLMMVQTIVQLWIGNTDLQYEGKLPQHMENKNVKLFSGSDTKPLKNQRLSSKITENINGIIKSFSTQIHILSFTRILPKFSMEIIKQLLNISQGEISPIIFISRNRRGGGLNNRNNDNGVNNDVCEPLRGDVMP